MLTRGSDQRELFKRIGDKDNQKIMSFWLWHVNFSPFQVPPGLFLSSFARTEALFGGWVGPQTSREVGGESWRDRSRRPQAWCDKSVAVPGWFFHSEDYYDNPSPPPQSAAPS